MPNWLHELGAVSHVNEVLNLALLTAGTAATAALSSHEFAAVLDTEACKIILAGKGLL